MSNSPEKKEARKGFSFRKLMDNNKFVFLISLIIAFFIWVAVAMYKSPEESYTIYNVPITISTENSIVSQKGYTNFWQSDEKIDVTVTGPRYLVTALTADDLLVSANLNTVDSAGISELDLKVSLKENSTEITISEMSKTTIEVYFDVESEKEFDIVIDSNQIPEHIAQDYDFESAELTVSTVALKGPETEINKIVSVVANPKFPAELMYATQTLEVDLSLEGASAADTVSVNEYVNKVDEVDYFVKVNISRTAQLVPDVAFTGNKMNDVIVEYDVEQIGVKIDTEYEPVADKLTLLTLDYQAIEAGEHKYRVKLADVLPSGVTVTDEIDTVEVTVTVS
ncbi:MAG: hypothetical protein IJZ35_01915 [Clostridia bacterium]|nr:hypothetical protein [Clostridia bacterium]